MLIFFVPLFMSPNCVLVGTIPYHTIIQGADTLFIFTLNTYPLNILHLPNWN